MSRTDEERALAKIDGSRLLDQSHHDALLRLDPNTPIVFQCHHGRRSQHAAEYFRREGFRNLYNLRGGIDAWSQFVDPAVTALLVSAGGQKRVLEAVVPASSGSSEGGRVLRPAPGRPPPDHLGMRARRCHNVDRR